MNEVALRPGTPADLAAVAAVYLRARAAAYPAMPRGVHPPDEVREWVTSWDLSAVEVWGAHRGDRLLGYARISGEWLEDLYVDPAAQGEGVGSALLGVVKSRRPAGFLLWVFESNEPARGFYRSHGLVEIDRTDGSGNEERAPDVKMAWRGGHAARLSASQPAALLRDAGGLVPGVGAGLADR